MNKTLKERVAQLCPSLFDSMDYSPPGSSVHGMLQARILEWVATSFSRGSSHPRIKPRSPGWQADSLPAELPGKPHLYVGIYKLELVSSTEVRECYFWEKS